MVGQEPKTTEPSGPSTSGIGSSWIRGLADGGVTVRTASALGMPGVGRAEPIHNEEMALRSSRSTRYRLHWPCIGGRASRSGTSAPCAPSARKAKPSGAIAKARSARRRSWSRRSSPLSESKISTGSLPGPRISWVTRCARPTTSIVQGPGGSTGRRWDRWCVTSNVRTVLPPPLRTFQRNQSAVSARGRSSSGPSPEYGSI